MHKVENIIDNINNQIKDSDELFTKLVNERLDLALKNYYSDLLKEFDIIENKVNINTIRAIRKINKEKR